MPAAERTIIVDRPVDDVFAFFTDPMNERRWRTHLKEVSVDGPVTLGSVVHMVVSGPGGRGIRADIEVTDFEPPSRYAFRVIRGPVRPTGAYTFAADGAVTRVSLSLSADLHGVKKLVLGRPVQSSMDGEMKALDRAKAIIEGS